MDVKEAAKILGVSPSTVYNLVAERLISCVRIPSRRGTRGKVTFTRDDLDEFIAAHRLAAAADLSDD